MYINVGADWENHAVKPETFNYNLTSHVRIQYIILNNFPNKIIVLMFFYLYFFDLFIIYTCVYIIINVILGFGLFHTGLSHIFFATSIFIFDSSYNRLPSFNIYFFIFSKLLFFFYYYYYLTHKACG